MWRNVLKSLERSLLLNSGKVPKLYINKQTKRYCGVVPNKDIVYGVAGSRDGEYIVPYRVELEKPDNVTKLTNILRNKLRLSKNELDHIVYDDLVIKACREKSLIITLNILVLEGVAKDNFVEYPWLIVLDSKKLVEKIKLLKSINGFRDLNDFVPLLNMQAPRLRRLVTSLNEDCLDQGNRIYLMAEKLNLSPCLITKYLVKRLFVLEIPLDMFKKSLQLMVNFKVEPMNVLKDLWFFRYTPNLIEKRFRKALQAKKDKIMPWMVRCPEPILQRSLKMCLDEQKILGETSVAKYLGERLGFSTEEAVAIMDNHPQVHTVRVTKIKEILDYLLNEAKFEPYEIANVPRILCHSLETTKQRLEELKEYGCRPVSLVIVCRSKKEYQKFLTNLKRNYGRLQTMNSETKDNIKTIIQ